VPDAAAEDAEGGDVPGAAAGDLAPGAVHLKLVARPLRLLLCYVTSRTPSGARGSSEKGELCAT
jgi:hypothetical protein